MPRRRAPARPRPRRRDSPASQPQATASGAAAWQPRQRLPGLVSRIEPELDAERTEQAIEPAHQAEDVGVVAQDQQAAAPGDEVENGPAPARLLSIPWAS